MKRIVVKIGSNILADKQEGLNMKRILALASDIVAVKGTGYEIVVVSSGAVAAGMKKLGLTEKPRDIKLKQAAAAIGQSSLMWAYEKSFGEHDTKVAQVLLTRDDLSHRKRYINSKNTLQTLLSYGVVPIVNENDTVVTDEIKFGDNDNLAALVAILIEAEQLIILSDVDGLYKEDPRVNAAAELIPLVAEITPAIEKLAGGAGSAVGTGGMYSKVLAARKATSHGICVSIVNGGKKGLLVSLMKGKQQGTVFGPCCQRISHRKGWIAYSSRAMGTLVLDDGAVRALKEMGRSLLPSGVVSVSGEFEPGDPVYCADARGKRIAKGLTNYSSEDVRKISGRQSSEIEVSLGYKYSDEIIHRDNLVIL
ncbi:MAG: glutamate 5-kinase [Nitrospirae bacterium]|nr:MAG: glutamate 5-kinase [Nitrospirota bacterium]